MAKKRRTFRVGEQIQNVIASELIRMSDPRFYLVTISSVVTSKDLRHAKVYWYATGGADRVEDVSEAFQSAAGYLRLRISKDLGLRNSPQLRFFYDDTLDMQDAVFQMMERVHQTDEEKKED